MDLHQEINQNMAVSAGGDGFALNNDELESLKNNQVWANSRANRRKAGVDKPTQRNNTKEWVNKSNLNNTTNPNASNLVQPSCSNIVVQQWPVDENLQVPEAVNKNNKNSSEDIDTIRENIRNSNESLRKSSSENILTIEESMRKNSHKPTNNIKHMDKNMALVQKPTDNSMSSVQRSTDSNMSPVRKSTDNSLSKVQKSKDNTMSTVQKSKDNTMSTVQKSMDNNMSTVQKTSDSSSSKNNTVDTNTLAVLARNNPSTLQLNNAQTSLDSSDVLIGSTADLKSPTSPTTKDPHSAYIDLSNNCRQFYFSHLKTAEAIKQSVRSARHSKALDKVQGKSTSSIDNSFDRLRAEMADLMEQDLSLMSQLLTLNDKIEDIKHHFRNSVEPLSQSSSYMSTGDATDSEYSDLEESGIFNSDFCLRRESLALNACASPRGVTKPTESSTVSIDSEVDVNENKPRKIEPSEREIIVYRKKKSKHKDRNGGGGKVRSRTNSSCSAEDSDVTDEESDDVGEGSSDDSESGTESTISCNSTDNNSMSDLTETESKDDQVDSGVQSPVEPPKKPEVTKPAKPVKGGISRNRFFLKFHKKNGVSDAISGGNSVLTLQGHHIPLEKFYIPQGLVYLKQSESENVFCQFSH